MIEVKRIGLRDDVWSDERGWGVNPLEAAGFLREPLGDYHVVSIKPGAVRGNHSHSNATEWMLVFGGLAKVVWRSAETRSIHETTTAATGPELFEVPPGVEHAVLNCSEQDIYLVSFSNSNDRETERCSALLELA